jgi:kynurenine formamidase
VSTTHKKTTFLLLSYPLENNSPLFGMNPPNVFKKVESIEEGDKCNSSLITFFNHNGTHVDAPRHFDEKGKKIADYEIEDFIFYRPRLIEIHKKEDEAIGLRDMSQNESEIQNCDLLLIRTGFYEKRGKKSYIKSNPWIDNEAATFLRQQPNLKAIGIDAISISSFSRLNIGEETHRILLTRSLLPSEPKLIIEDMNLSDDLYGMKKVFVIPLFMSEADSAPCTVFAELEIE